jgi:hypothetical protein
LPKDWEYVRVWEPTISGNTATVKIECLYKKEEVKANRKENTGNS